MHFCWSLKNLLVLIYAKLHSKSCDYLYLLNSKPGKLRDIRKHEGTDVRNDDFFLHQNLLDQK